MAELSTYPVLTQADPADLIPLVDVSANATKIIEVANLIGAAGGYQVSVIKSSDQATTYVLRGLANVTTSGIGTEYRDALGIFQLQFTDSSAGSTAGVVPTAAGNYKTSRIDWLPIYEAHVRTDSSATEIANANGRWWFGLFSATPQGSATPAVHGVGFRIDNPTDGTTIKAWADNGSGSPTVVSTGITWAAATAYKFKIILTASAALFYINGNLVATITTTLPASGTDLGLYAAATQIASGAGDARKHIGINRVVVTQLL